MLWGWQSRNVEGDWVPRDLTGQCPQLYLVLPPPDSKLKPFFFVGGGGILSSIDQPTSD